MSEETNAWVAKRGCCAVVETLGALRATVERHRERLLCHAEMEDLRAVYEAVFALAREVGDLIEAKGGER